MCSMKVFSPPWILVYPTGFPHFKVFSNFMNMRMRSLEKELIKLYH